MNTSNNLPQLPPPRKSPGRWLYAAWLSVSILPLLIQPASATTIWEKATEIMKDVYQQILLISTIAAIVTASVALLMMNFSRSGRTVEESRAWLKRIAITWAILNGLGYHHGHHPTDDADRYRYDRRHLERIRTLQETHSSGTPENVHAALLTTVYSFLAAKYFTFRHAEKPE